MSETQTATDSEKLRAFVKKMHDEGAAGFADGPSPWETWDDKSGILGNNRVWEGTSKRIYPKNRRKPSLGDRVLSGLATLSLATMIVGIAGVYFSDHQPRQVAFTGVQPLPIDRAPAAADNVIASLEQLPAPAAGEIAPGGDRDAAAQPAAAIPAAQDTGPAATAAPPGDDATQAPALPDIAASFYAPENTASPAPQATRPDTDNSAAKTAPAPLAPDSTPARAPVAANASVATDVAPPLPVTAVLTEETAIEPPPPATTPHATPDTAAANLLQQPVPAADTTAAATTTLVVAETEPAAAAEASMATAEADPADDTAAAAIDTPDAPAAEAMAAAETATSDSDPVDTAAASSSVEAAETAILTATITALEALPATTAGVADTGESVADDSSVATVSTTADTRVAVAEQDDQEPATPPAEAAAAIVPAPKTGDWVVNLASYTRERTASRMLAKFRDQGVDAELVEVMINDKPMYRIRVAGFANSREARAQIAALEKQLGLEGVWIARK